MMRDRVTFWLKVATLPVTAGLWYLVYLAYRGEEEDEWSQARYFESSGRSEFRVASVRVPKRAVGAVIGKGGGTVKRLQDSHRVRITFVNRTEEAEEEIVIRGVAKNVAAAEREIRTIIAEVPEQLSEETRLESRFIGPLIGRNGDNIRALMARTGAKIDVERASDGRRDQKENDRGLTIRGTRAQIDSVLQHIADLKSEITQKERRNEDLRGSTQTLPESAQPLEVLVSAVKKPNQLFMQLTTTCYQLESLVKQLTDHYSLRRINPNYTYRPGQLVAAVYQDCWHRARVAEVTDDIVDVDYLDYGDAADVPYDQLQPLVEPVFLKLPFQAIEVQLHGVEFEKEDEEDAMTFLEDITYQSNAIPLLAKVVSRDGALPTVRLFDPNKQGEVNFDINEALIKSGLCYRSTPTP